MIARKSFWVASLATVLLANAAFAQRSDNKNPVINNQAMGDNHAWIVKYGSNKADGNGRGEIAVQLKLTSKNNSEKEFTGVLYRYDSVEIGMQNKYKKIEGPAGQIDISGQVKNWNPGNTNKRKRLTFKAVGVYIKDDEVRIVKIVGTYSAGRLIEADPGNGVTDADVRRDDAISIVIHDTPANHAGGNPGQGGGQGNNSRLEPTPADDEIFVAYFMNLWHPCEEEPDTDVLNEDGFVEEPPLQ